MMTRSRPALMPAGVVPLLQRSWVFVFTEAVGSALGTLLLGAAAADPEMGVRIEPDRDGGSR